MNHCHCITHHIRKLIAGSRVPEDPLHAENTLVWLLRLEPNADDALQIAALGHDIERALEIRRIRRTDFTDFDTFKAAHALNSAKILTDIMKGCQAPHDLIGEVYRLVSLHETGGDVRSDLLKNADSISFFDVNLPLYYERNGREQTLRRCVWGYRRLSPHLKEVAKEINREKDEISNLLTEIETLTNQ
jgi:hypothetical protein